MIDFQPIAHKVIIDALCRQMIYSETMAFLTSVANTSSEYNCCVNPIYLQAQRPIQKKNTFPIHRKCMRSFVVLAFC